MLDLKCEEADDRRVEEIARQLEEIEQARVSADWANNREHDDRRIEANVGGPPPSNIREYLDELIRSFARVAPIDPSALKTLYDRKNYPAMLGWMKDSMRLDLQVGLRIVDDRPKTSPQCGLKYPILRRSYLCRHCKLKSCWTIGLTIPLVLVGRADRPIEQLDLRECWVARWTF